MRNHERPVKFVGRQRVGAGDIADFEKVDVYARELDPMCCSNCPVTDKHFHRARDCVVAYECINIGGRAVRCGQLTHHCHATDHGYARHAFERELPESLDEAHDGTVFLDNEHDGVHAYQTRWNDAGGCHCMSASAPRAGSCARPSATKSGCVPGHISPGTS